MLVLSRKRGESIRIADTIELTVLDVRKGRVKLGIAGPPEVPIHREEVHQRFAGSAPHGPTVCLQGWK